MVLFNSPLPYDKERMAGMATRPPAEAADYFVRQGRDADGLMAELRSADERRRYVDAHDPAVLVNINTPDAYRTHLGPDAGAAGAGE